MVTGRADDIANPIGGGATTLLLVLPPGATFTVDVHDSGGSHSAYGSLRLYRRPL